MKKESKKQESVCYKCQMFRMNQSLVASLIFQEKKYNKHNFRWGWALWRKQSRTSELFSDELRTKCPKGTRHRKIGGRWKKQELGEPVGQGVPGDLSDVNKGGGWGDMRAGISRALETVESSLGFILGVKIHWSVFKQEIGMI